MMLEIRPECLDYFVKIIPPRGSPDLLRLAVFLWEKYPDFDSFIEEKSLDDDAWVKQSIVYKKDPLQRVDIVPLQMKQLIVRVSGSEAQLAARAANFIANRAHARVSTSLNGPWRSPKSLRKQMGDFDIDAALNRMVMMWAEVEQPAYSRAHHFSSYHRKQLFESQICGCYYCMQTFPPSEIRYWIDDWDGVERTALCPKCGINSVIGSISGYPIESEFLSQMHNYWFRSLTPEIIGEMQSHGNLLG